MRKYLIHFTCFALLAGYTSCSSPKTKTDLPDMQYIDSIAEDYACRYRQLLAEGSTEMQREDFLLDLNAKLHEVEQEAGHVYAIRFKKTFTESAFKKH